MDTTNDRVYWYGTPKGDDIDDFYGLNDVIYGGAGNDSLAGGVQTGSSSVLIGGAGRDELNAVSETNTLRFDNITDSYRDASTSHSDTVKSFDVTSDKLDLTALGYTHLGNGHGDSLKLIYNASQNSTYLKSLDTNSVGQRFELVLTGDYSHTLTDANFRQLAAGTQFNDEISGVDGTPISLAGYGGRDIISGSTADERLIGGAGGDKLSGGAGADEFVYTSVNDSTKSDVTGAVQSRDTIQDFSAADGDSIDLSALNFSGFGDGHNGTLKVVVSAAGDKTALKSLDTDSDGNHFEIMFNGTIPTDLNRDTVIFANTTNDTVQNSLTRDDQEIVGTSHDDTIQGGAARDEILGFEGNDRIDGAAGHDSIAGGKGVDTLTGGEGRDDFVFYSIEESFRTDTADFSDVITDYQDGDIMFALDLGFTKVSTGVNGTLRLDYDAAQDQTYLHSLEADADGRYFQVTLAGEHDKVSIVLDGLSVDVQPIEIVGVDPTGPAPV
jgi:Ca2+-binding RTX toxin-like protein